MKWTICLYLFIHRMNLTANRHKCAHRCDRENEHSIVTTMVLIVMLQRWDGSGSDIALITMCTLGVTAMAADSAVIALSVATTFTVMCILCKHRCQLLPLSQRCQLPPLPH